MSHQLPVILFLLPFAAAIFMPMVGSKARGLCRPIALLAVFAMFVGALADGPTGPMMGVIVVGAALSVASSIIPIFVHSRERRRTTA